MEIILREDVKDLGRAGEVVKVKDGYARNYLLPQGLAYAASEANKKRIAFEATRIAKQRASERDAAQSEAARLTDLRLQFAARVGEEDKLFGSITAGDVQRKLEEMGVHVDKRKIELPEPIRALGEFKVAIKLHADVRPEVTVIVIREEGDDAGAGES
jgi:large subunit ribosomal protein L9